MYMPSSTSSAFYNRCTDQGTLLPPGFQGAVAAVGVLSLLLIMCIAVLSLLLFKAKQELFEVKSVATNIPNEGVTSFSPVSTIIDTKENIAYERVIKQSSHAI